MKTRDEKPRICRECDPAAPPHPVVKGQRRAQCTGCGYDSHWFPGRLIKNNDGRSFLVGYPDRPYEREVTGEIERFTCLKTNDGLHLSECCCEPIKSDFSTAKMKAIDGMWS